ncbi:hypothetical protein PybrP1_006287 [[Pythium] brassicae (nom. inval.)]|nr:hypothetical protein PybrP1_006287 [[Pythium] brassicae (nom. inval.)]
MRMTVARKCLFEHTMAIKPKGERTTQ